MVIFTSIWLLFNKSVFRVFLARACLEKTTPTVPSPMRPLQFPGTGRFKFKNQTKLTPRFYSHQGKQMRLTTHLN